LGLTLSDGGNGVEKGCAVSAGAAGVAVVAMVRRNREAEDGARRAPDRYRHLWQIMAYGCSESNAVVMAGG
jgi:hypothetical protein